MDKARRGMQRGERSGRGWRTKGDGQGNGRVGMMVRVWLGVGGRTV